LNPVLKHAKLEPFLDGGQMTASTQAKIAFPDTLRGVAALAVLFSHYGVMFWANRPGVAEMINAPVLDASVYASPSYFDWMYIPNFWWGSFGVGLFFVISGFVIPFSFQKLNAIPFLIGRFFRIWPLYAVGFSFSLVMIYLCGVYFGNPWNITPFQAFIHYLPGVRDLYWSRPIDGIIWTLDIEMKFYVVCAFLIPLFRKKSLSVFTAPLVLVGISLWLQYMMKGWLETNLGFYWMGLGIVHAVPYLIFMFIGVVFHYAYQKAIRPEVGLLMAASCFCLYLLLVATGPFVDQLPLAWNYGYAVLLFAFAQSFPQFFKETAISNFFAKISYPLYAIHGVFGYVALRIALENGFKAWFSIAAITAVVIIVSWAMHVYIELPSNELGKRIAKKFAGKFSKPTSSVLAPAE